MQIPIFLRIATLAVFGLLTLYIAGFAVIQPKQKTVTPVSVVATKAPSPTPALVLPLGTLSAQAVFVLDDTTGSVLGQKHAQYRFSPASTTKLMTSLLAVAQYKPTDILTAKRANVEGTVLGLKPGDTITFHDALFAMLLPSNNDVAMLMADNYPGGESAFVTKMNAKAQAMHLARTQFADPAGLDDDTGYTTAEELTGLARVFMQNPTLATVVSSSSATVIVDGTQSLRVLSTNKLLGYHGIDGVKTGHTEGAKDVLITTLPLNGHRIFITVMKSDDRFADTKVIVDYLVKHSQYLSKPAE